MNGDPRVELGELWRGLNRALHERMRQAMRGQDLNPPAMYLLRHVAAAPGLTVSELARKAGVVKSGVSKMIDQVAGQGLVEKRPDPADQRLIRLFLTEQGVDTTGKMEAVGRAAWYSIMEQIPPADLADFEKGLRILEAAIRTANQAEGDDRA